MQVSCLIPGFKFHGYGADETGCTATSQPMSAQLKKIDERTQLVGKNRLELLVFGLCDEQNYGINVFKVNEVLLCPEIIKTSYSKPGIIGMCKLRCRVISVLDLSMIINNVATDLQQKNYLIVAEFSGFICGFLVNSLDRILNLSWDQIREPPAGLENSNMLTSVTSHENRLVQIIDIEKIMYDIDGKTEDLFRSGSPADNLLSADTHVLLVDDSGFARTQIKRVLQNLGVRFTEARNGRQAINLLSEWYTHDGTGPVSTVDLIVTDVEMPELDGYTLCRIIKTDKKYRGIKVMLHSSMNTALNKSVVQSVFADDYLHKFNPRLLEEKIKKILVPEKYCIST